MRPQSMFTALVLTFHDRYAILPCRSSTVMGSPTEFNQGDVLNEVLQSIRLRSAVYCRARMTSRWGFRVEQRDHARFHYVTSGQCWIEVDGTRDPIQLSEGDLVIMTHGQAHTLRDHSDS